ncbi:MAG: GNAT family N-acetyltransferase [Clostridiales bacterium]|jgi:ribosomal-protein-alanine N-acetyltransferase|nr:GNAT family N-acetyltransferase [Clostridiales bacterium]
MNLIGTNIIETPRLILRRLKKSDAPLIFGRWAGDAESTRYMSYYTHKSIEDTYAFLRTVDYGDPKTFQWAVTEKANGELIGSCGGYFSDDPKVVNVGYILDRSRWGRGYATEALRAMNHYLLMDVGADVIASRHHPDNPASGRVMQKAGMRRDDTERGTIRGDGQLFDIPTYSLVYDDLFYAPVNPPEVDGELTLVNGALTLGLVSCTREPEGIDYDFNVLYRLTRIGHFRLTVGANRSVYYLGHLGYTIAEEYRGHSYAARACQIVLPLAKKLGMRTLIITCNPENAASARTAEKLGGINIRTVDVPRDHFLYRQGDRRKTIYQLDLDRF